MDASICHVLQRQSSLLYGISLGRRAAEAVSPGRTEGVKHTNHKLMRWHSLHDKPLVLNVADIGVGSELHLL